MADRIIYTEYSRKAAAALVLGVVLSAGCASTRMEAQWADPAFANQPLQGAKVLVVCAAKETVVRRVCQDEIAARIRAIGAQPLAASGADRLATSAGAIDGDKAMAAAREMDAKGLFAATISQASSSLVGPSTTVGVGVGSGGWGGGTRMGGGVGISFPVGGSRVDDAYGANMVLTDVATGRIMWTIKVTAPASRDVGAQIRELARAGVESAQASGVF